MGVTAGDRTVVRQGDAVAAQVGRRQAARADFFLQRLQPLDDGRFVVVLDIVHHRDEQALRGVDRKAEVRLEDFSVAFPGIDIATVPSDYRRVAESINLGVPVVESASGSALAKALVSLGEKIESPAVDHVKRRGGLLSWLGLQGGR